MNPHSPYLTTDLQLYVPGNGIEEFQKYAVRKLRNQDVPTLSQLAEVVLKCLTIVWIPLDAKKDDAQAIFESLNDKGTPLSASELLCNYLFRPIMEEAKGEAETLHNDQWLAAIKVLGDDDRFEEYLRHLTPGWRAYLAKDADDDRLPTVIDTVGNLCLLSAPANSSVGQGAGEDPFEAKKKAYATVCALARQIKEHTGRWDIAAVRNRSETLAKKALQIWRWGNE